MRRGLLVPATALLGSIENRWNAEQMVWLLRDLFFTTNRVALPL